MRYVDVGGVRLSAIGLGTWQFGSREWGYGKQYAEDESRHIVGRALDLGINLIDTANVYAGGRAEVFLGEVLRDVPRDRYVLATKLYFPMPDGDRGLSAAQIRKQLDASLARLGVDHVDLYQCHRYDEATPLEETMAALTEAVRAGKVRYLGFSEWSAAQIEAAFALPGERFVSSQPQYSLLWRVPEAEVFPTCQARGIGQIVWSPLAQGILTGKYEPGRTPPAGSRATSESMSVFLTKRLDDRTLERVRGLVPIARDLGLTMSQLALAWVLRRPEVASAIVGASRPEQVAENARASGVSLDAEAVARIEAALGDARLG